MQKIKMKELTPDNFQPYGKIISSKDRQPDTRDVYSNWWASFCTFEGKDFFGLNLLQVKKRDFIIDKIEHHKNTKEIIIPLGGEEMILIVAPSGEFKEDEISGFKIEKGKGVILNEGVRHFLPYPIKNDADCVIIYKSDTEKNDLIFEKLSQSYMINFE